MNLPHRNLYALLVLLALAVVASILLISSLNSSNRQSGLNMPVTGISSYSIGVGGSTNSVLFHVQNVSSTPEVPFCTFKSPYVVRPTHFKVGAIGGNSIELRTVVVVTNNVLLSRSSPLYAPRLTIICKTG